MRIPLCAGYDIAVNREGSAITGGNTYSLQGSGDIAARGKLKNFVVDVNSHNRTINVRHRRAKRRLKMKQVFVYFFLRRHYPDQVQRV